MSELNPWLVDWRQREDVAIGAFHDLFQHRQVRYNTANMEVYGSIEDNMVAIRGDPVIWLSRWLTATRGGCVVDDQLLDTLNLCSAAQTTFPVVDQRKRQSRSVPINVERSGVS